MRPIENRLPSVRAPTWHAASGGAEQRFLDEEVYAREPPRSPVRKARTEPRPRSRACRRPARGPRNISLFHQLGNSSSRADPAGDPRNASAGKPRARRESPPIPVQPANAMTGLSRRRSRVRVPSLPLKYLQNSIFVPSQGAIDRRFLCIPLRSRTRNGRQSPHEDGRAQRFPQGECPADGTGG